MKGSASMPTLGGPGGLSASRSAAELIVGPSAGSRPGSSSRYKKSDAPAWIGPFCLRQSGKKNTFDVSLQPNLVHLEFAHSSAHGLNWEGVIVKRVTDQALKLGVTPGWKIVMVDGKSVNASHDIWQHLQAAKWEWRTCSVSFETNIRAIRVKQAMDKAAELKAEEERLSKLYFKSNQDDKHLEQVREGFSFQGYTDGVDNRGITFAQLKKVLTWTKTKCHRWRDAQPVELSKTSGFILNMDFLNLQHLYHWLIMPATKPNDCSMSEMLAVEKQVPNWFCILWWGMPLKNITRVMESHIKLRDLNEETTNFWIGAFANRPHSLADGISLDPNLTWAHKGMSAAGFKILLCLDHQEDFHGTTNVFKRLWCLYEWQLSLGHENATFDVAVASNPKPWMLTLNLTRQEEDMELNAPGSGWKAKAEREKALNLPMFESLAELSIENANTTVPHEGVRILNCIAGLELASKPAMVKHPNYTKCNQRLIAMFALVLWRRIMALAPTDQDAHKLQLRLADMVRADVWRQTIHLSMAFLTGCTDERMVLLMRSLPPSLKEAKIDLRNMGDVTNDHLVALGASLPRELETLHLNIENNEFVDNIGIELMLNKLPATVGMVHLGLKGTSVSAEMQQKKDSLQGLRKFIADEADKGNTCIIVNLVPSVTGRMLSNTIKCKVFPPSDDN